MIPSISFEPIQAYSSIFTYLPTTRPNESFLGFSRSREEDQITEESWEQSRYRAEEKLFAIVRKNFLSCNYCFEPNEFVLDKTERGKTEGRGKGVHFQFMCRLYPIEFASDKTRIGILLKKIPKPRDSQQLRQIEINEFAVKTLCDMVIKAGIDRKHILKHVWQVKEKGYLTPKNYCELETKTLKYELKEVLKRCPSIFTYLPPISSRPDYSFLGFSRYEKQDQITEEPWIGLRKAMFEKVFNVVEKKLNVCTCCADSIPFAEDEIELGIRLKELSQTESVENFFPLEEQQLHQIEINEFAVKTLCKMAIEVGIDKKHILKHVWQTKEEGYLTPKSYSNLKLKTLKIYGLKEVLTRWLFSFLGFSRYEEEDQDTENLIEVTHL